MSLSCFSPFLSAKSAKKSLFLLFLVLAAIISTINALQAQTASRQTTGVSTGGTKFYIYTPPGYTASSNYPLLVYLHGGGDINSSNDISVLLNPGSAHHSPPWLINQNQWPIARRGSTPMRGSGHPLRGGDMK